MACFLLVHGSWHGGWCWQKLVPLLQGIGHAALAFDLPGSGDDPAPAADADLDGYARRTIEMLDRVPAGQPAILVGHSLGGLTLSAVGEAVPERLAALVYVTALMLPDGVSAVEWRAGRPPNPPARARVMAADGTSTMPPEAALDCFYGDCAPEEAGAAAPRLGPQAMRLYETPVRVSAARWGSLPRWYLYCDRDVTITPEEQRRMVAAAPGTATFNLDAAHSPMLSQAPALAESLARIAAAIG